MKPAQDIAAFWAEQGIHPSLALVFYCRTGSRASLAFYDAWLMGWYRISVYDDAGLSGVAGQANLLLHSVGGTASLSGAGSTSIRALPKIAQAAMNMAATSGPITKPFRPKIAMPPRVDTNTT